MAKGKSLACQGCRYGIPAGISDDTCRAKTELDCDCVTESGQPSTLSTQLQASKQTTVLQSSRKQQLKKKIADKKAEGKNQTSSSKGQAVGRSYSASQHRNQFTVTGGKIHISDPCYLPDGNYMLANQKAKNGTWKAKTETFSEVWAGQVMKNIQCLIACHVDYFDQFGNLAVF